MDQRIINLYDEYTHKPLNRQEFLKRLTVLAGGTAAAMSLLPVLENNDASAAITKSDELFIEYISYPGAFHNDTAGSRYNEMAAKLAWRRTMEFFEKHLK